MKRQREKRGKMEKVANMCTYTKEQEAVTTDDEDDDDDD